MLSKVLKGDGARKVPAMTFTTAAAPAHRPAPPVSAGRASADEDHSQFLEKIRALETGLAAAKKEAFDSGYERGELAARAELNPVLERLKISIADVVNLRPELRRRAEKDAVGLALQIARRVLHRELSMDANALNALARVVFDRLSRSESWQVTVHPQFADALRGALPGGNPDQVRINTDPSCAPGTFIVRSSDGVIDASIDSQLAEISRGLTDRLARK